MSAFVFAFRRELVDLKYEVMKIEVDLDEHVQSSRDTGDWEVRRDYLQAKLNLARHKVTELERRLAASA